MFSVKQKILRKGFAMKENIALFHLKKYQMLNWYDSEKQMYILYSSSLDL